MNFGEYTTKLNFPTAPVKPRIGVTPTAQAARSYATDLEHYETVMVPQYQEAITAYRADEARLQKKFFDDAAADLGYTDNPKRAKLENIAWSMGHSSGFSEVYHYLSDLVVLIEPEA